MAGWPKHIERTKADQIRGGQVPSRRGRCARCLHVFLLSEMQIEADWKSSWYGYYACSDCYRGAPPEEPEIEPDDFTPYDGLLHT